MNLENAYILFEQSGTFKRSFQRRGVRAFDFDIDNQFGQTDYQMDLFQEIESCFDGKPSVFDRFTARDFVFAFFPCTYFSSCSQVSFSFDCKHYWKKSVIEAARIMLERNYMRSYYFGVLLKLVAIVIDRKLPFAFENPWAGNTFLKGNFSFVPSVVHWDRSLYGDFFRKPTAYWFFNFKFPFFPPTPVARKRTFTIHQKKGIERSLISQDYSDIFVDHYILGFYPGFYQPDLFNVANLT